MAHYTPRNIALFQPEMYDLALCVVEVRATLLAQQLTRKLTLLQILETLYTDRSVDVLHLFREMLVDIICETSLRCKIGALQTRVRQHCRHYLVQAIDDFPKRGVLVRSLT